MRVKFSNQGQICNALIQSPAQSPIYYRTVKVLNVQNAPIKIKLERKRGGSFHVNLFVKCVPWVGILIVHDIPMVAISKDRESLGLSHLQS